MDTWSSVTDRRLGCLGLLTALTLVLAACSGRASRPAPQAAPSPNSIPEEFAVPVASVPMNRREDMDRLSTLLDEAGVEHESFGSLSWTVVTHAKTAWKASAWLLSDRDLARYALTAKQLRAALRQSADLRGRIR